MIKKDISLSAFINMAGEMAKEWEDIVRHINGTDGQEHKEPRKAAVDISIVQEILHVSAMHVLRQYYTVRPD